MIIFKTTFHFDEDIHEKGLAYIRDTYVKKATASGVLYEPRLSQILVCYSEAGSSYVLKFRVECKDELEKWMEKEGGALQEDLYNQFGEKVSSFVTLKKRIAL